MSGRGGWQGLNRRRFLAVCSAAGVGQTLLPGVLLGMAAEVESDGAGVSGAALLKITPEMIDAAAAIAGLRLTAEQKAMMLGGLSRQRDSVEVIRTLKMPNSVAPAFVFDPVPAGVKIETEPGPVRDMMRMSAAPDVSRLAAAGVAEDSDDLAFASVREWAELVKTRRVSSVALTKMYLARLRKYDPLLHFVITYTEERALAQAAAADAEIAAGRYRGPLHGIPWGAKDLLAVKGYATTWGAAGFEQQSLDEDATVVKRLDAAGAVLVAKLSMGSLAQGDLWFGGRTRNPWNPRQGSSGSSAGSASAVAAGCVGFAIGTETLGSISAPCTRCGVTGLRPTFGFVPRTGAMALSWTMDKIGPIARSVEDCALVLSAIYGPDGHDRSVRDAAFRWDAGFDWKMLRVGYLKSEFDVPAKPDGTSEGAKRDFARRVYDAKYGAAALDTLRNMGVKLVPMEMPHGCHFGDMTPLLEAEAAAAFEELTLSGRDRLLTGQKSYDWPNQFRVARFYSAVDYVQAQRARTLAMAAMEKMFADVDVMVTPSDGAQLTATNLTGHPAVIVPNGVRGDGAPLPEKTGDGDVGNVGGPGTPVSITFLGALYSDARVAAFARVYQRESAFYLMRPPLR
ncbi:amidase [Edaphobacter sp.]|uniref:amidase n=1 Tax=Edaphobacter sp. TaxID=1934404 RepID=UPI002DBD6392|nr:amidase [Edaphobacter sp.]HEU5339769.1 amidase [Edaphobacter sp.]